MKINNKLKLVAAGFLLPISILLYLLIYEKNLSIDFTKREQEGTKLLRPIYELQHNVKIHFLLTAKSSNQTKQIKEIENHIDSLFHLTYKNLNQILNKSEVDSFKEYWIKIKYGEQYHQVLMNGLDQLTFITGNRSNLILDPDLDSYYLMDVVLHRAPKIQKQLFSLITDEVVRDNLSGFKESLHQNVEEVKKSFYVFIESSDHKEVKNKLKNIFGLAVKSIEIVEQNITGISLKNAAEQNDDVITAIIKNHQFQINALDQLENLLSLRINGLKERMYIALSSVGLLLILTGFLFYFITRHISHSVQILEDAATKVMNGELNIFVDIKSNDEFGGLSENFNRMIEHIGTSIKENYERLTKTETALNAEIKKHTIVEEALHKSEFLFKQVWDISSQGMRLTDGEGNIIAANDAFCQIVDLPLQMIKGKPFSNIYHPSIRKDIMDVYKNDFNNQKIKPHFEREAVLWNDKLVCLEFSNSLLTLSDKSNLTLSTIEDITLRKKFEAELKQSAEQLRNLTSHLQSVREEERRMIAREIHDELGQVLTVLKIQVSLLSNKLRDDQKELKNKIETVIKVIDQSVESVQRITAKLRPGILDDLGLIPAIEWQAEEFKNQTGIRTICDLLKDEIKVDAEKSTALFRILQEALTNIARHAEALNVEISLSIAERNFILQVIDDGKGISEKEINDSHSLGLLGIKERALLLNGEVKISGNPGKGTHITVTVPISTTSSEENYDKYSYSG